MEEKLSASLPRFVEPVLGVSSPFVTTLSPPPERVLLTKWLIYKLPDWLDDNTVDHCLSCTSKFSIIVRRHHCRGCGGIFCSNCASSSLPLPQYGVNVPERLCRECVHTQTKIFDCQEKILQRKDGISQLDDKHKVLNDVYVRILKEGSNFTQYDLASLGEVRMVVDESLCIVSILDVRKNTISRYMLTDLHLRPSPDSEILSVHKNRLGDLTSCYTIDISGVSYIFKSGEPGQSRWMEGLALLKYLQNYTTDIEILKREIRDLSSELDSLIRYQMNFSVSQVYKEQESPLKLLSDSEIDDDVYSSEDEFTRKYLIESTPPNALKIIQLSKTAPTDHGFLDNFKQENHYGSFSSTIRDV